MIQKTAKGKCIFYGEEISEQLYGEIIEMYKHKPIKEGYEYTLRKDLTWEEVKVIPEPKSEEVDDSEALSILLGGAV